MRTKHKVFLGVILFVALIGLHIVRRYQHVPWEEFQNIAVGATRIKIIGLGMVPEKLHEVLYEENDSSAISEFVENIIIKRSSPGG